MLPGPSRAGQQRFGQWLWQVYREVPAYRSLWREAGIHPGSLRLPAEFERLPVVGKRELLAFAMEARCRGRLGRSSRIERTSGSTGQPFEVPLSASSRRRRQRRFFKALLHCGYRPGQRLLLLSTRANAGPARFLNWHYALVTLDEAGLAAAYRERQPAVLYGPLNTLLSLAAGLGEGHDWPRPKVVVSTAEELTPLARARLSVAYGVEPCDFYGLTETGLLAWRRAGQPSYRLAEGEFHFEFLPCDEDPALERLILTELGQAAMPLVRFDTGDLVRREHSAAGRPVAGFSGRVVDSLLLPSGRKLSPYQVTLALEHLPGLTQFRVTQREDLSLRVEAWTAGLPPPEVFQSVQACLRELSGGRLAVSVVPGASPEAPERKFRPIRSLAVA